MTTIREDINLARISYANGKKDSSGKLRLDSEDWLIMEQQGWKHISRSSWEKLIPLDQQNFITKSGFSADAFLSPDGKVVLAYRGTEVTKVNDLVTDFQLALHLDPDQQTAAKIFVDTVITKLEGEGITITSIHNVGHSLGGYLAQIGTLHARKEHTINATGFGFHDPGIGEANETSPRFVHLHADSDVVRFFGGESLGEERVFDSAMSRLSPISSHFADNFALEINLFYPQLVKMSSQELANLNDAEWDQLSKPAISSQTAAYLMDLARYTKTPEQVVALLHPGQDETSLSVLQRQTVQYLQENGIKTDGHNVSLDNLAQQAHQLYKIKTDLQQIETEMTWLTQGYEPDELHVVLEKEELFILQDKYAQLQREITALRKQSDQTQQSTATNEITSSDLLSNYDTLYRKDGSVSVLADPNGSWSIEFNEDGSGKVSLSKDGQKESIPFEAGSKINIGTNSNGDIQVNIHKDYNIESSIPVAPTDNVTINTPGEVDHIETGTHTVQPGDTLSKLAQTYNTTIDRLLELNPDINNKHLIRVGDELNVPSVLSHSLAPHKKLWRNSMLRVRWSEKVS